MINLMIHALFFYTAKRVHRDFWIELKTLYREFWIFVLMALALEVITALIVVKLIGG